MAKSLAELRAEVQALSNKKDAYLASYREKARKLNDTIDQRFAEEIAAAKVAGMSKAEKQAVAAELTKVGDA